MTTLVGISAEKDESAVVLASDISTTSEDWDIQGDVAQRVMQKEDRKKIYIDESGEIAVGMSGVMDEAYSNFLNALLRKEINFKKCLPEFRENPPELDFIGFPELFRLNVSRTGGKLFNPKLQNGLLIGTRYDNKPTLQTCWPFGLIERRNYTAIGSGNQPALKYIHAETTRRGILSSRGMSLSDAVEIAMGAIKEASRDLYTSGSDMVVVKKEKILEFKDLIEEEQKLADRRTMDRILERIKG